MKVKEKVTDRIVFDTDAHNPVPCEINQHYLLFLFSSVHFQQEFLQDMQPRSLFIQRTFAFSEDKGRWQTTLKSDVQCACSVKMGRC